MRTTRQLRAYIKRLESVARTLRSEAMLRNSPRADKAIEEFDALIKEGQESERHDRRVQFEQFVARVGSPPMTGLLAGSPEAASKLGKRSNRD